VRHSHLINHALYHFRKAGLLVWLVETGVAVSRLVETNMAELMLEPRIAAIANRNRITADDVLYLRGTVSLHLMELQKTKPPNGQCF
jgi:hypothetical protein